MVRVGRERMYELRVRVGRERGCESWERESGEREWGRDRM